jgi:tetratricopeptide (TPR) repeat protein
MGSQHLTSYDTLVKKRIIASKNSINLREVFEYIEIVGGELDAKTNVKMPSILQDYVVPKCHKFHGIPKFHEKLAKIFLEENPDENEHWESLISDYKNNAPAVPLSLRYINLARIYHNRGFNDLLQYCSIMAILYHPHITDGHLLLGISLVNQGDLDLAKDFLDTALSHRPFDPRVLYMLGLCTHRQGANQLSAHFFKEVIRIRPDWADAKNNFEIVNKLKDTSKNS